MRRNYSHPGRWDLSRRCRDRYVRCMSPTSGRKNVLAIVLAGGEGKRLMPLTADRAKPAVPFGGIYRLIDFALSNVVNSGYLKVVVLTQYKSHSLDRHVTTTWRMSTLLGNYVTPVPAQQRVGKRWYLGSADAIFQSLNLLTDEKPDIVVVVGADHVYRMDFSQMVDAPRRVRGRLHRRRDPAADLDGRPVRRHRRRPGLAGRDPGVPREADGPGGPAGRPARGARVDGQLRLHRRRAARRGHPRRRAERSKHDMGGDIVPWFVDRSESAVYDYRDNDVAGSTDRDRDYWRDVGTMRSYYDAHMDLVSPLPEFNLYNNEWPIYTDLRPEPAGQAGRGRRRRPPHGVQLDPLAGRRGDRRHGQQVGALTGGARRGRRRGVRLGAAARRPDRRRGGGAQRDPRQERRGPAGRPDRGRPRGRPVPRGTSWTTASRCWPRSRRSRAEDVADGQRQRYSTSGRPLPPYRGAALDEAGVREVLEVAPRGDPGRPDRLGHLGGRQRAVGAARSAAVTCGRDSALMPLGRSPDALGAQRAEQLVDLVLARRRRRPRRAGRGRRRTARAWCGTSAKVNGLSR